MLNMLIRKLCPSPTDQGLGFLYDLYFMGLTALETDTSLGREMVPPPPTPLVVTKQRASSEKPEWYGEVTNRLIIPP